MGSPWQPAWLSEVSMSDDETTVLVNSHTAWGTAGQETEALAKMVGHWNSTFQDTEIIHVIEYRGELETVSVFGHVEVDGEIVKTVALEISGNRLEKLHGLVTDAELLAEEILTHGTEVEEDGEGS